MNLTLTMQFDNLDQLQSFLNRNPAAAAAPVAAVAAAPAAVAAAPVAAVAQPAAVAAVPAVAQPAVAAAPLAAVPTPAPAADPATIRQTTMTRLRELAGAMDDPGVLGQFINSFGVARYSDLPDDQVVSFQAALAAEFGA